MGEAMYCLGIDDVDGDGLLDVIGAELEDLVVARNVGGEFEVERFPYPLRLSALGCVAGDVTNDGRLDVVVADPLTGFVMVGNDAGGFDAVQMPRVIPSELTISSQPTTQAVALVDLNGDDLLDVYIGANVLGAPLSFIADDCGAHPSGEYWCGQPDREYEGLPNVVLLNRGDAEFEIISPSGGEGFEQTLAVATLDVDNDGLQDVLAANDGGFNHLYLSRGDGTLVDATEEYGLDVYNHGMGIAHGDLDGDGHVDLAFSDVGAQLIFFGSPDGFTPWDTDSGLAPIFQWGWGTEMEDLDNDGDLDVLFVNELVPADRLGFLEAFVAVCASCAFPWPDAPEVVAYRNDGAGRFTLEDPLSSHADFGRLNTDLGGTALATADLDGDGILDAVTLHRVNPSTFEPAGEGYVLWGRGRALGGHVSVDAPIGARVEVCASDACQTRERGSGGGYVSVRSPRLHFGLADATTATIRVEWPRGEWHDLGSHDTGALVDFTEAE